MLLNTNGIKSVINEGLHIYEICILCPVPIFNKSIEKFDLGFV